MNSLPESVCYPDYKDDISGNQLFSTNRSLENYWADRFKEFDAEIARFIKCTDDINRGCATLYNDWEMIFLRRVFGSTIDLFNNLSSKEIYDKIMFLFSNRANVQLIFDNMRDMFGLRMRLISSEDICKNGGLEDELMSRFLPDKSDLRFVALLEMLLPADRLVKVTVSHKNGLGYEYRLGNFVLERGFFVM